VLKKTVSLMCIIPFLLPITLTHNTHSNFKSTMAKVDKVIIETDLTKIEKGILPYEKQYKINMLNEIGQGLVKQAEEKREAERQALIKANSKVNYVHYNPYNLREVSKISVERLSQMLEGKSIQYLAPIFVQFEEAYGVNCLFIMGIVSLESNFGDSNRANNGSNNLTGHGVYNQQSRGSSFDSWESCVEETFRLLSEDYLSPNGMCFNGYSIWNVNTKYAQSNQWTSQINRIIRDLS
jgi:beta-N-acetylglucosaminidase